MLIPPGSRTGEKCNFHCILGNDVMVGGPLDVKLRVSSVFDTSPERSALIPHVCRSGRNVISISLLGNDVMSGGLNRQ